MAYDILSSDNADDLIAAVAAYQIANPTMFPLGGMTWNRYFNQVMVDDSSLTPGDATAANQVIEIARLTSLLASLGATTDVAVPTDADGTVNAHIRGLIVNILAMSAKLPATLGSKADAASLAVTQSTEDKAVLAAILAGILAATPAGENHIGQVGGNTVTINATITRPTDTNVYAPGDVICNSTSAPVILQFTNCVRNNNGSGVIQSMTMTDSANETIKLDGDLFLYDTTVAMDNDNSPFTPTDAEQATCIGVVQFSGGSFRAGLAGAGGNGQYPDSVSKGIPFVCKGGAKIIYGVFIARNAYVPISGEVFTFRMSILQD